MPFRDLGDMAASTRIKLIAQGVPANFVNELYTFERVRSGRLLERSIMSDLGISGVAAPLQAIIATKIRQPDAIAQASAVKTIGAARDQMAATLSAISSGVNIQV
jgi:hypothetical protein